MNTESYKKENTCCVSKNVGYHGLNRKSLVLRSSAAAEHSASVASVVESYVITVTLAQRLGKARHLAALAADISTSRVFFSCTTCIDKIMFISLSIADIKIRTNGTKIITVWVRTKLRNLGLHVFPMRGSGGIK